MNAQSVWVGHDYAYVYSVQRNVFPSTAQKVRVISIRKYQQSYKKREDTLATVTFEDTGAQREVNVRNLYDFWDSYKDEKEFRRRQREVQEAERIKEANEREQLRLHEVARKRNIADNLAHHLGIDPSVVRTNYSEVIIEFRHLQFLEGGN